MAERFCVRCGRGFAGGRDDVLCDDCAGSGAAVPVAGGRQFPAEEAVPAEWQPGDVLLDLYEVRGLLGAGGMARVYRVRHRGWNVDLAVKTPRPEMLAGPGGVEAFAAEAGTWVELGLHPHIVTCFYVRNMGGVPRVFAELVEGGSLADWIADRRLYAGTPGEVLARLLDVAIQFAWGLGYAHGHGLVHQDVKPANVLLTGDGVAKVTDFGLSGGRASAEVVAAGAGTTVVRGAGGTPAYLSPEQADAMALARSGAQPAGASWLTRRTDIWSWAVSVLEMFTGERTWQYGQAAPAALQDYLAGPPAGIPPMPGGLATLLGECLETDSARRPHDFAGVAGRLTSIYQSATGNPYPRQDPGSLDLNAESLNNRALSLLDLGREQEAEDAWKEALKQDPYHPETTYNRGLLQWRAGRMDDIEIVRQLEQVCKARPREWLPQYLLAQVHLERDDCQAAIAALEAPTESGAGRTEVTSALDTARQRLPHAIRLLRTFEGHQDAVLSVCLSTDGRHAVSGSKDGALRLWEVATGTCLLTFTWREDIVNSVCLSSDGHYALSGGGSHFSADTARTTLRLWAVGTGECARAFEGHGGPVRSVCLSADGRYALSGSDDKTLKLWEVATGKCLRNFEGHEWAVRSVWLSADGRHALSGGDTLRLWEVATGRCLRTFGGYKHGVMSVCLSADGRARPGRRR